MFILDLIIYLCVFLERLTFPCFLSYVKVEWDMQRLHVNLWLLLPIAGSFKALYLSLSARGVRVRRRSSLPMIYNTVSENTLKDQNI